MKSLDIKIKEIPIEDYYKLEDITNEQQLFHYNLKGPYAERFLKIDYKKFQEYMSRRFKTMTYAAVNSEGKIIGFVSANINKYKEGFVEDLFVAQEARGLKLGSVLFEKILDWFKDNQVENIDLHVSVGNENVIKFYEKYGFKTTGYTLKKK